MTYNLSGKKVWVAGHRGMVGSAVCRQLKNEDCNIIKAGRDEVNLVNQAEVNDWMNAVMKDRLTWTQVSDLQYWNSPVVPLYNIQGIPYNVLVDPNGKVVAESLRGDQLAATLEQVLPK